MRLAIIGIALLGLTLSTSAEASPHHKASHRNHYTRVSGHHHRPAYRAHRKTHHRRSYSDYRAGVTQYLPHPPGCPRTAFCGCGAAYEVYGQAKRFVKGLNLFLARDWKHLPHASPGPGMAAASNSHVFILRQHIAGDVWLVADHNSGHHQSRLHARSIAGFTIVNPHG